MAKNRIHQFFILFLFILFCPFNLKLNSQNNYPPVGIENPGKDVCFMNATLQSVMVLGAFVEYLAAHMPKPDNQYAQSFLDFAWTYTFAQQTKQRDTINYSQGLKEMEAALPAAKQGGDPGSFLRHLLAHLTISKRDQTTVTDRLYELIIPSDEEKVMLSVGEPEKLFKILNYSLRQNSDIEAFKAAIEALPEDELQQASRNANSFLWRFFGVENAFGTPPPPFSSAEQVRGFKETLKRIYPETFTADKRVFVEVGSRKFEITILALKRGKTVDDLKNQLEKFSKMGLTQASKQANILFKDFFGVDDAFGFLTPSFSSEDQKQNFAESLRVTFTQDGDVLLPETLENDFFNVSSQWRQYLYQLKFQTKIGELPQIPLIVYQWTREGMPEEISLNKEIPLSLITFNLPPKYLIEQLAYPNKVRNLRSKLSLNLNEKIYDYKLVAVVANKNNEHAIAYVFRDNKWWECDDRNIKRKTDDIFSINSEFSDERVPNILFYERVEKDENLLGEMLKQLNASLEKVDTKIDQAERSQREILKKEQERLQDLQGNLRVKISLKRLKETKVSKDTFAYISAFLDKVVKDKKKAREVIEDLNIDLDAYAFIFNREARIEAHYIFEKLKKEGIPSRHEILEYKPEDMQAWAREIMNSLIVEPEVPLALAE